LNEDNKAGHELCISGRTVTVYPAAEPQKPVIYLNTFGREGDEVYGLLKASGCPDFTLAAVSVIDWNHDMAPWDIPPISKDDTPCTGGADDYLRLLTGKIVPAAEALVPGGVSWRALTGYSLAGLFAVYSIYRTALFSRIASMSGSMWFPDFQEYVRSNEMKILPEHMYFSLGDRESLTKNPYLRTVQERTENIAAFFSRQGADTVFQSNPGNHYQNAAARTAAGIGWLLSR
jgi:predicted alpha/beta superfamily hydrolase